MKINIEKIINSKIKVFIIAALTLLLTGCSEIITTKEFKVEELQKISFLSTMNCTFKNVMTYEIPHDILGFKLPNEKYFLLYNATINIGIDMKEIEYDEATSTLKVPKAKILGEPQYDVESFKEYIYQKFMGSKLDVNDVQKYLSESLMELKASVEANDSIMSKAQNLAKIQIETLIDNVYGTVGKNKNIIIVLE